MHQINYYKKYLKYKKKYLDLKLSIGGKKEKQTPAEIEKKKKLHRPEFKMRQK